MYNSKFPVHSLSGSIRFLPLVLVLSALSLATVLSPNALSQASSAGDVLILANSDQLTGKLVATWLAI
jgi:hypothetical protein